MLPLIATKKKKKTAKKNLRPLDHANVYGGPQLIILHRYIIILHLCILIHSLVLYHVDVCLTVLSAQRVIWNSKYSIKLGGNQCQNSPLQDLQRFLSPILVFLPCTSTACLTNGGRATGSYNKLSTRICVQTLLRSTTIQYTLRDDGRLTYYILLYIIRILNAWYII